MMYARDDSRNELIRKANVIRPCSDRILNLVCSAMLLMCRRNIIKCQNLLRARFINDYLIIESHAAQPKLFSSF